MDIRKEYKFALPTSLGLLFGVLTGSLLFYLVVGTIIGLVWGYSEHMITGGKTQKMVSKKASKPRKASKSKNRKK